MAELIKAASIARITSKETGKFLGFLVKSDNTNDYYQVTCLKINGHCEFFCTCKGFKFYGHCKHCNACKELCAARKAIAQEKALIAEIETTLEAERVNELAQAEVKEVALASAVEAVIAEKQEAVTKPIQAAQEAMMHVAILTLPIKQAPKHVNRGFVMAPVAELGGRVVMLAS